MKRSSASILAAGMILGLAILGGLGGNAIIAAKQWERSVLVKGLSEREYVADQVIWPIQFVEADNQLTSLYKTMASNSEKVKQYLIEQGISEDAISIGLPEVTDKLAQQYGNTNGVKFRYSGIQTVTVYSSQVMQVRGVMQNLTALLAQGVALNTNNYNARTEFIFTRLNDVKPEMIEEATLNAREVAEKFAADSNSQLGKIKRANQGQFSIFDRDSQHPHIKKVRVVSTIEYTLAD
ncbi:SIMPL domain-containing protein [Alteromonas gilva]|uniref:SIMPL domain-containing protein n=1 Tax=Alteromonas gilva TaxID=2987522 RepID=A0ABT5KZI8_9ALTE|nr:SIMPL domain-containing protein [Alteromonas gilva]MDC8830187.1 SIMPL domain-containing protein [Alteromonas gilva]